MVLTHLPSLDKNRLIVELPDGNYVFAKVTNVLLVGLTTKTKLLQKGELFVGHERILNRLRTLGKVLADDLAGIEIKTTSRTRCCGGRGKKSDTK